MVKAHLCFEKYDLRQLLTRIIEEVQSDFRTRRTVSSFSLGPASIGLPVTFVILTNHFSSYPPAETLYLVWLLNYTTSVFEAVLLLQCYSQLYLLHMHYVARDQETFTWTLCRRLCKAAIRGNPTLQCARWTLCVCSLCTMTSIPGKDSHAEEEACARDTNNIKEINTSRYPQFIKLYTVCFSFSFGPRN